MPVNWQQKYSTISNTTLHKLMTTCYMQKFSKLIMSASQSPDPTYAIGDSVMLSTFNGRHEYKKAGKQQTAKFFPRWDGPYRITKSHPEASTYTLIFGPTPSLSTTLLNSNLITITILFFFRHVHLLTLVQ
jgi:hypothetical protein